MIGYLKGRIISKKNDTIILDVNGVGYKVYTSTVMITEGSEIELYIYTSVSQDAIRLFGFYSEEELKIFESLIAVSGIGPKLGQQIICFLGIDNFSKAINNQDATIFNAVPKVGPKLAAKIIVELKDKISWQGIGDLISQNPQTEAIILALEQLGYKKAEFFDLLSEIPADKKTEGEKLRWILTKLAKK